MFAFERTTPPTSRRFPGISSKTHSSLHTCISVNDTTGIVGLQTRNGESRRDSIDILVSYPTEFQSKVSMQPIGNLAGDLHGFGVVVRNAVDQQQKRIDARFGRRFIHRELVRPLATLHQDALAV